MQKRREEKTKQHNETLIAAKHILTVTVLNAMKSEQCTFFPCLVHYWNDDDSSSKMSIDWAKSSRIFCYSFRAAFLIDTVVDFNVRIKVNELIGPLFHFFSLSLSLFLSILLLLPFSIFVDLIISRRNEIKIEKKSFLSQIITATELRIHREIQW